MLWRCGTETRHVASARGATGVPQSMHRGDVGRRSALHRMQSMYSKQESHEWSQGVVRRRLVVVL